MTQTETACLRPSTTQDVADIIMDAAAAGHTLAVTGNGTRRGFGNPVAASREP